MLSIKPNYQPTQNNSARVFIDLRAELDTIFYGDKTQPGAAFKVILRHVDRTQRTEGFNPLSRESHKLSGKVDGIWPTWDEFVDTTKSKYMGAMTDGNIGAIEQDSALFFFKHNQHIDQEDSIIEIVTDDFGQPIYPISYIGEYDIVDVEPMRGNSGRVEFFRVYTRNKGLKSSIGGGGAKAALDARRRAATLS